MEVPLPESSKTATEADLLSQIAEGNETAFARLFEEYKAKVYNLAFRYLGNREDAELATQDAFIRVWQHAGKFRGSAQVWTWLYRITVNVCMNMKSRKQLQIDELDEHVPADEKHGPAETFARRSQEDMVRQALDSLPPDQRMAIVLSRFEGLSYEEIARTMNKSVQAVATLLFRAKENLKSRLGPHMKKGQK